MRTLPACESSVSVSPEDCLAPMRRAKRSREVSLVLSGSSKASACLAGTRMLLLAPRIAPITLRYASFVTVLPAFRRSRSRVKVTSAGDGLHSSPVTRASPADTSPIECTCA